jgi:hypothetical protein
VPAGVIDMENQNDINGIQSKKSSVKWKLFIYLLALIGLVWVGIWAYHSFNEFKTWLAAVEAKLLTYGALGLIFGFVYLSAAYKIHERIKVLPEASKKLGAYSWFIPILLFLNPIPLSLAAWLFTLPGDIHTSALLFFIGCSIGGLIVIALERLFSKKDS